MMGHEARLHRWMVFSIAAAGLCLMPIAARAQFSDGLIKVGVLTDMASVYADGTGRGSVIAAEMAAKDFGGSVAGVPVQVVSADHQNKPDIGAAIAREWYDKDKVDVIVDVPTSSVALAVQQITKDKKRVLLLSGGGSSDLTGSACSPNGIQWTYDTYALARVSGQAAVQRGYDKWAFITADYAFGQALERDAAAVVKSSGGQVVASVRAPLNTADFSSFLLQAQSSGAKLLALANAGADTTTAVKQAAEFGLKQGGQDLLALLINDDDVHGLGLPVAQGLFLTTGFYWDMNDETRAFAKRFHEAYKLMPTMYQAGVYSAVTHYLKAVQASGTDDAGTVIATMRATPVNDFFARNGRIREDGRMVHDMYLMQVKSPADSKGEWDQYKLISTVKGDDAYRPLNEGGCPHVGGASK